MPPRRGANSAEASSDDVFRTANLPIKSVKELAEEYGRRGRAGRNLQRPGQWVHSE